MDVGAVRKTAAAGLGRGHAKILAADNALAIRHGNTSDVVVTGLPTIWMRDPNVIRTRNRDDALTCREDLIRRAVARIEIDGTTRTGVVTLVAVRSPAHGPRLAGCPGETQLRAALPFDPDLS